MGKISEFLSGIKVLEEVNSPYNGEITVIKSLAFGTYFQVGGLTQSGGIIKRIWNKVLRQVKSEKPVVINVLILGLGGGSIIEVVKKYWPEAKITAVDIDKTIVDLGKKYLRLSESELKIVISDAEDFIGQEVKGKRKYDLILVDLYRGDEFPEKFEKDKFLKLVKSSLNKNGVVVFNRLYYGEKRKESVKFGNKLEKFFPKVDIVYPEANVMFVCYK